MYPAQGPYAWVPGRRATSKVTATSGGRLTNRYAWVPGRPTRRACLGVNLPLRVPPCKHYPEEVTELKMAALILLRYRQRRLLRRNRIFRDRTNPLHKFNDLESFWQFRFRRADILQMNKRTEIGARTFESEGRAISRFHRPENSAESLSTMNINSSSNGLSWTAPVPHFLFVCFLLLLFVFVVFNF